MCKALRTWHVMSVSEMLALIICYSLCKIYLTLKAWENSKDTQPSDIFLPKTPRSHLC